MQEKRWRRTIKGCLVCLLQTISMLCHTCCNVIAEDVSLELLVHPGQPCSQAPRVREVAAGALWALARHESSGV